MTGVPTTSNTPSPVPPTNESRSYKPYVPPSYTPPSTTVSQNIRRPPPPPSSSNQARFVQPSAPRPPPPSKQPPTFVKPVPPINRPTPPVNRPAPPLNKPGQSQKPIPAVRTNIATNPPNVSPHLPPQTAQKPSKIAVQWPPPSEDTSSTRPVPPKKPMVPRK